MVVRRLRLGAVCDETVIQANHKAEGSGPAAIRPHYTDLMFAIRPRACRRRLGLPSLGAIAVDPLASRAGGDGLGLVRALIS